ncbi:hypothetical protein fugu_016608 [Takifugu bimaculatus]|uniref:Uncharacterized protein n=1 Tax=Takifugu bimaculatus TaxID=433685 RepID=A0A4Z2BTG0_9TELE|nr:hypothetical protein fugu_016608 [Takifugu bimaculatus]
MKKTTVFLYQFFKDMRNALFYSKPADTRSAFAELIAFRGALEPLLVLVLTRLCVLSAVISDCGMNCHKLCKDQVAFECKKNSKGTNAVDSPTPSSTPVAMGTTEGSDECPFPRPLDESKDWSPESPDMSCSRPQRTHSCTQTEAPQLPPAASDITDPQPALLPAAPPLPSCPSPVRTLRHCAKWENREEDSKPTYECLESDNHRLVKANETLRVKLREAEREVDMLKTLLKRNALHPVEEDSS